MPMTENLLTRVRALLAKAESTQYEHEADAFNRKAAELIARHGIDEALLAASGASTDTITSLTIGIDNPYSFEKASLLAAVAKSLRCQALAKRTETSQVGNMILVGYGSDLERVTLIYTSLLLQATSQVVRQRPTDPTVWGQRTQSVVAFRKSWWAGFSVAVLERLEEAERRAAAETGASTPGMSTDIVLRDRSLAVRDAYREMFPRVKAVSRGVSGGDGYRNGQSAGRRADLGATRLSRQRGAIGA